MSVPIRILLLLTSGSSSEGQVNLECEIQEGRYFLHAVEAGEDWSVELPGRRGTGLTRSEAMTAGLLAGFSQRTVEAAIRRAEKRSWGGDRPIRGD